MIRLGILSLEHPHAVGNHLPALRYMTDRVQVVAIADSDRGRAQPWLDAFGADYLPDRDSLLARPDVDAVLVTSRNWQHAADTIAAARSGKDILCDKPIATSVADARAMAEAVRQAGVRFITTFPVRFNTSVRRVKQAIDAGELGEIQAIMATNHGCMYEPGEPAWVRDLRENGGGCLIDHTVHVADVIRWWTGAEYDTVSAQAANALRPHMATEDLGVLHGSLTNGVVYQIDASWSRRGRDPMWGDVTFRVVGTRGSASLDLYNNQRVEIYRGDGVTLKYPNHLLREHGEIFLDYANARELGEPGIAADAVDGLRTIELVFAAYDSVSRGACVNVDRWAEPA